MKYLKYILIFIPLILGTVIANFSNFKTDKEYNKLNKSKVMPPNYIFSIVWGPYYIYL